MTTTTRTPTDVVRVAVRAGGDGATVADELRGGGFLRPRLLGRGPGGVLRIALVQTTACLLSGDRLTIEVEAGPGAAVELVEPAGTVAHDVRGGPGATWHATVRAAAGATVLWPAAPLVVAAGADLERTLTVGLDPDAVAVLCETLVLGRAGEGLGRLTSTTVVRHAGRPLLHDRLDTRERAAYLSQAVAAGARVVAAVAAVGVRPPPADDVCALHGPGALRTFTAGAAHALAPAHDALYSSWRAAALARSTIKDPDGLPLALPTA